MKPFRGLSLTLNGYEELKQAFIGGVVFAIFILAISACVAFSIEALVQLSKATTATSVREMASGTFGAVPFMFGFIVSASVVYGTAQYLSK